LIELLVGKEKSPAVRYGFVRAVQVYLAMHHRVAPRKSCARSDREQSASSRAPPRQIGASIVCKQRIRRKAPSDFFAPPRPTVVDARQ
jgi:hypothetical protein